jgi:nicotinamide-nucleotide amidase
MIKVSILTIGDEVRIGQIVNTNAAWLSEKITRLGAFISNHITIGDDFDLMVNEIKEQIKQNDIVITTGGLGPTHDDITKPVLLNIFDDKLVFDDSTFKNIQELFKKQNREISERNKLQAYVPSKAKILTNLVGTAPGLLFEFDDKAIFSLPGVPSEMKFITENFILNYISNLIKLKNDEIILYKTLNVAGIFESNLADIIGPPEEFLGDNSSLAFLPSYKGIRLRIGTIQPNFDKAQNEIERISQIIYSKAGEYIWGEDDKDLTFEIGKLLKEKKLTLSVAESCTGGLLGGEITKISGSSEYFMGGIISYSNEVKINQLGVNKSIIELYGAVSFETASEMAINVKKLFKTDIGISITGIAGPTGGTPEKPVGTVFIGISYLDQIKVNKYVFGNDRNINRERAIGSSLLLLYQTLIKL